MEVGTSDPSCPKPRWIRSSPITLASPPVPDPRYFRRDQPVSCRMPPKHCRRGWMRTMTSAERRSRQCPTLG